MASPEKTKEVYKAADKLGLSWPLDNDIPNAELGEILFPDKYKSGCWYMEPDYPYIHRELAKSGATMALLGEEYCWKCHEAGETPYMNTQFGDKYRRWARVTKATMRIQHKPGDAMQVDWAGDTLPVHDPVTGEQSSAYLFVAVLPCSCYTYAEACEDMKTENWLACHVHAFQYFGGVPRLLIPDNCKTATTYEERKLDKAQMLRFSTCKFVDEGPHIILKGVSGNGKTYIACALGNAACRRFKKVRYVRMPELLDELSIARSAGELKKCLASYKKVGLLILDKWLIRLLSQESYNLLEIVETRYQRSIIFCTQYQSEGWYTRIDPNPDSGSPISEAIMDRIIHNTYEVLVEGHVSMLERNGLKSSYSKGGVEDV